MADTLVVKFMRLRPDTDDDIPMPRYMTEHAAGMDICAAVPEPFDLLPGQVAMIPTGFAMALPAGFEAQIRPRSGLAARHAIGLINSPGTIDADYRGEVFLPLINFGGQPYQIRRGDRVAQMVIQRVHQARVETVDRLEPTGRSSGGFGHTGR
jgi:dUTP pyrophosphatase